MTIIASNRRSVFVDVPVYPLGGHNYDNFSLSLQSKVVAIGDRILAIDGQILDGADFLM